MKPKHFVDFGYFDVDEEFSWQFEPEKVSSHISKLTKSTRYIRFESKRRAITRKWCNLDGKGHVYSDFFGNTCQSFQTSNNLL